MKKLLNIFICTVLAVSMLSGCSSSTSKEFTAKAKGYKSDVEVKVIMDDTTITNVEVLSHEETDGIGTKAIDALPSLIVDAQSINVDVVGGATFTSKAIIEAVSTALTEGGFDLSKYQKEAEDGDDVSLTDATYDVVVVGAGGAGLAAAITAAEEGANVVVIEKTGIIGGNTIRSWAEIAAPNSWLQKEQGIEGDSGEILANDMYVGGGKLAKKELLDVIGNNVMDDIYWLKDTIGVEYETYIVHEGGHTFKRNIDPVGLGSGMITPMADYLKNLGVDIFTNVKGESLITEDGKVVGIEASSNNKTVVLTANNGVVLTTGGFGGNIEMRERYNKRWETLGDTVPTTGSSENTGDGIVMAEKIGANLLGMEYVQLYPFNNPVSGTLYGIESPSWSDEGFFYVNQDGNRFVNELGLRDPKAEAILAQDLVLAIYNQKVADNLDLEEKNKDEYAKALEDGVFFKADTLDEIADYFGVNAENLKKTLVDYNAVCNEEKEDDFGRTTSLHAMEEGPWFAMVGVVSVHFTMGGIEIDTDARVLNTNGEVIDGLYAAGETTGGIHGNNRVGACAIADILVYGRIAGQSAASDK